MAQRINQEYRQTPREDAKSIQIYPFFIKCRQLRIEGMKKRPSARQQNPLSIEVHT